MYENYGQDNRVSTGYFARLKRFVCYQLIRGSRTWRRQVMRVSLTSIFMTFCMMQLSASGIAQQVTLKAKSTSVRQVFMAINKQTGYHYVWSARDVDPNTKITVDIVQKPLDQALVSILNNLDLGYEIDNKTIVIKEKSRVSSSNMANRVMALDDIQQKQVSGRIVDAQGKPVRGVSIRVKGTELGTVTDEQGYFKFNQTVDAGQKLECSCLGYKPMEVTASTNMGTIVLQDLSAEVEAVDIVINTGYQKISKERAAGSFSQVTAKDMEGRLQTGLLDRVEGLVPGMSMVQNSASPQNTKNSLGIEVRGRSTINAQGAPLVVVDGMPYEGDLTALNPNDIETVTVLKDASAASIYGVRSSNGVIVVVTRMGKEGPARIDYSNTLSFRGLPNRSYLNKMSSAELVDFQKEMFNYRSGDYNAIDPRKSMNDVYGILYKKKGGVISEEEMELELDVYRNRDRYSSMDEFLNTVRFDQQHNLALSGGVDRYSYHYSLNYTQPGDYNKGRATNKGIGFNIKNNFKLTDWVTLRANILGKNQQREGNIGFDYYNNYIGGKASYFLLRNEDGSPGQWFNNKSQYEIDRLNGLGLQDETYRPIEQNEYKHEKFYNKYINLNFGANFKIIKGLDFDLSYQSERTEGYNGTLSREQFWEVASMVNDATQMVEGGAKYNIPKGGQFSERRNDINSYTLRGQLNYQNRFSDIHEIIAIAGAERREIKDRFTDIYKYGYDESSLVYKGINEENYGVMLRNTEALFNSYTMTKKEKGFQELVDRFVSFYANASYTYNRKLTLSGSIRMDQSNLFGTDIKNQYKPLWSVGALYRLPELNLDFLDKWSARMTYGVNGNVPKETGPYLISKVDDRLNPYTGELQSSITTPPNPLLRWERTNVFNFGLDFSMWNNRLGATIDLYSKKTEDLLGNSALDPTLGWSNVLMNYGNMRNNGIEVGLTGQILKRADFSWTGALNFAYNNNKITKLYVSQNTPYSYYSTTQNRVGVAMGSIYSIDYAGLNEEGLPMARKADGTLVGSTQQLTAEDLIYSGTTIAPYNASLSNNVRYKNFSLNFMFIFNGGHVMRGVHPEFLSKYAELNYNSNFDRTWLNYWKQPGDELKNPEMAPKFVSAASGNMSDIYNSAQLFIQKADYIKLRDVSLSYTLPQEWIARTKLNHVRITGQIQNVWRWAANKDNLDPEVWSGYSMFNDAQNKLITIPTRGVLTPTIYNLGISVGL